MSTWLRLLCGLGVLWGAEARAFVINLNNEGQPLRWNLLSPQWTHDNVVNRQTRAIRYYLGSETYTSANRTAELEALRNAFRQWQTIPGTVIKFEEAGLLTGRLDVNPEDNTNVVYWVKGTTLVNNQLEDIRGATGVTYWSALGQDIVEADIVFNGARYGWFTDYNRPTPSFHFVEGVAVHEIGHLLGLAHTPMGSAAMFARAASGVSTQADVSADEVAAARALYGDAALGLPLQISGRVTVNGAAVAAAAILAEDAQGNLAAGTVSEADGRYELKGLSAGTYQIRATPLDPEVVPSGRLIIGQDIERRFTNVFTDFLPSTPQSVSVAAGAPIVTLNLPVASGFAPFRITRLREPTTNPQFLAVVDSGLLVRAGEQNLWIGVYSPNLPTDNVTLSITGDGLTVGPTEARAEAFPGLNLLSVSLSVAATATPGLRSFVVRRGNDVAYGNGFLKILPPFPDINRDGFDDRFQREYFGGPFAAAAGPGLDVDGDSYSNEQEYLAGSNPLDRTSVLRIESVHWEAGGATLRWRSAADKRYRVSHRIAAGDAAGWKILADGLSGQGATTEYFDATAFSSTRIYRVEALR